MRSYTYSNPLENVSSARQYKLTALDPTLFFGMNLWTRLNFSNTFALTRILTLLFASQSSQSLNLTGIPFVNGAYHACSLIPNCVLIPVILPPFVVVNLTTGSTSGKV